jgi:hypothetical protein
MKCFKVFVKTTNVNGNITRAPEDCKPEYIDCSNSVIYILGETFADVERLIHPDWIESIEHVGSGLCA